ncbi:hypothetical protein FIT74_04575 [Candidatus Methylopumilus universalis]|uniref:Lipoprotein n=1 Tax=Candidatus Methylopumilus universalis TaxID=2588536 RepID=A0ABX5VTY5_9PROT|nr:hypothetical protein [Candidatus Methylopumilus universalis]QDC51292.1 hypothetical protein FIT73_04525 [Candidatus Methylopumilus universalis]QDC61430.1 hypothetical protein FIT74_04575 [Candidatus Methylopumilus universalis]
MIKHLLLLMVLLLSACQNKTYYFDCSGKEAFIYRSLSSDKENISKRSITDSSYHILLKKTFLEYKLDGISCKKSGDDLIQCGDVNCYSNFAATNKSDRCKNDAWIYTSFNLISGDYHQRLYLPNLKEDEYSIDSYSLQCKRVKNALDD